MTTARTLRAEVSLLSLLALLGTTPLARCQTLTTQPAVAVTYDATQLFEYDRDLPLLATEQPGPTVADCRTFKISYYSSNNQTVPAILVLPPAKTAAAADTGRSERLPCVILMHGLGQNKSSLALMWPMLARAGYAVFCIDAQYHGDRKPSTRLDLFGLSVHETRDMLVQTVVDLRRAIDYLDSRPDIDPARIGYAGFSMGGILGTLLTAVDARVQAPILALAGGDWRLMAATSELPNAAAARKAHPEFAAEDLAVLDPVDPIHWVSRIAPRPILFINGDADKIVPVACAHELQSAAGPNREVYTYKGGHVPAPAEFPAVLTRISGWLDAHVKGAVHGG